MTTDEHGIEKSNDDTPSPSRPIEVDRFKNRVDLISLLIARTAGLGLMVHAAVGTHDFPAEATELTIAIVLMLGLSLLGPKDMIDLVKALRGGK